MSVFKPMPRGGLPKLNPDEIFPDRRAAKAKADAQAAAESSKPKPKADNPPECWRVARVARVLDVSKKRVYQLVQERRLEAIRLGPRQMRILKRSVEGFVGGLLVEEAERDY